jgi:hypothetical protein
VDLDSPEVRESLNTAPEPGSAARLTRAQITGAPKRAYRRHRETTNTAIMARYPTPASKPIPATTDHGLSSAHPTSHSVTSKPMGCLSAFEGQPGHRAGSDSSSPKDSQQRDVADN